MKYNFNDMFQINNTVILYTVYDYIQIFTIKSLLFSLNNLKSSKLLVVKIFLLIKYTN